MSTRISANQSVNHATDNQSDSDSDASSNHEQSRTESPFFVSSKVEKNQINVTAKKTKRPKNSSDEENEIPAHLKEQATHEESSEGEDDNDTSITNNTYNDSDSEVSESKGESTHLYKGTSKNSKDGSEEEIKLISYHKKADLRSLIPPEGVLSYFQQILAAITLPKWNPLWDTWDTVISYVESTHSSIIVGQKLKIAISKAQKIDPHLFGMRTYVFLCFVQLDKLPNFLKKKYSISYWVFSQWILMENDKDNTYYKWDTIYKVPNGQEVYTKYFGSKSKEEDALGKMNYKPKVKESSTISWYLKNLCNNISLVRNGFGTTFAGHSHLFVENFTFYKAPEQKETTRSSRADKVPEVPDTPIAIEDIDQDMPDDPGTSGSLKGTKYTDKMVLDNIPVIAKQGSKEIKEVLFLFFISLCISL
jgi:hypothetical protein